MLKRAPQHFITLTAPALSQLRVYRGDASRKLEVAWSSVVQAEQAVIVWINGRYVVVVTKLRLPELKAWALEKVSGAKPASEPSSGSPIQAERVEAEAVQVEQVSSFDSGGGRQRSRTGLFVRERMRQTFGTARPVPAVAQPLEADRAAQKAEAAATESGAPASRA